MPVPSIPEEAIEQAFRQLKQSVSSQDAIVFQSTTLEDVWKAAEEIERAQRQRKSLRNLKRLEPLLNALERYSKPVEILCNGTPYLPWIWAPIKLMLELASGHIEIFDKLLDAYAQIADVMPQFDRLESAFKDDPRFRMVLALVYTDIIEFHRRAYKFFRRRAWQTFFSSLWNTFDSRFNSILKNLARHKDLVMREATTIDLVESREWRARAQEELEAVEKRRLNTYIHDTAAWLNTSTESQDDELDKLVGKRLAGTCEWILRNHKLKEWKDDAHAEPILWVKGIPGAGKTILCSYLIGEIKLQSNITTAYYICNSYTSGRNLAAEMMRSLTLQLLRQNVELAAYVFENFANKAFPPSLPHLRTVLKSILSTIPTTRIFIDGLDEYPPNEQRSVLQELLALIKQPGAHCRALFSSRDVDNIRKALQNKPTISFRDEEQALDRDIRAYVHENMTELREKFASNAKTIDDIETKVIAKADGMFLWVRLVLISLKGCCSLRELENSAETLPEGLDAAYGRILDSVVEELNPTESARALKILEWLACSFRPLKSYEIQDGIVFSPENTILDERAKMLPGFLDICKPLVEEGLGGTVDFVHYSAKEYILHIASGPFLDYRHAHYDIAFSCVTYLNTSASFRNANISSDELRASVAKGFHGLHPYANEFWFEHLLKYAKCSEDIDAPGYPLQSALEELLPHFWKEDPGSSSDRMKLDDTTTIDVIRSQLEDLANYPWLQLMGLDILKFRAYLSQEKFAHLEADALEARGTKNDPTYFSETSKKYQDTVRFLLNCTNDNLPEGITSGMLQNFKSIYMDTAYLCRYPECPRHSIGFSSPVKLAEHESSHAKPLRCADPSCDFFPRGFSSKSGLLKHNRKYHPAPEDIDPPKFEPRKEEPPPPLPQPELPPPPPIAPPPVEVPRQEPRKQLEPITRQAPVERVVMKRVSQAKRGLHVHNCDLCPKIYSRAEGLRRHKLIHNPPSFICHYAECERAFYREDLLVRHLKRHEMTDEKDNPATGYTELESSIRAEGEEEEEGEDESRSSDGESQGSEDGDYGEVLVGNDG